MDKATLLDRLSSVLDHIGEAEEMVERQRQIVALFDREGEPSEDAKNMLAQFRELHASHIALRDQLIHALSEIPD